MNRDFVYNFRAPERRRCRAGGLSRWVWALLCCGVPGAPCHFCRCCEKRGDSSERNRPRVNQSTATAERVPRPHRPHAPRGRKSTPEMMSALRCALSQLQGEPAPERASPPALRAQSEPG